MGLKPVDSKAYFFDTYAFIEAINGNKNYQPYMKGSTIITTMLNLMELHYITLKDIGERMADTHYEFFKGLAIEISDDIIKKANRFRYANRKKGLSYVDCISYTIARMRGIPFLTGDNAFKGMEGVEFVR
ncbi:MAG TPA: PIN domain-containing protein [Candidatus Nanoarchaeia archaeon]|nr:PIN domain-containing protein [Candidatus Nanoarchaeia archaeon]